MGCVFYAKTPENEALWHWDYDTLDEQKWQVKKRSKRHLGLKDTFAYRMAKRAFCEATAKCAPF
jgi:hypothetical protein